MLDAGQHRRLLGVGELHDPAGAGLHRVDLPLPRPVGGEHVPFRAADEPLLVVVGVHVVARRVGELHHLHAGRRFAVLPFLRPKNVTLCHLQNPSLIIPWTPARRGVTESPGRIWVSAAGMRMLAVEVVIDAD